MSAAYADLASVSNAIPSPPHLLRAGIVLLVGVNGVQWLALDWNKTSSKWHP